MLTSTICMVDETRLDEMEVDEMSIRRNGIRQTETNPALSTTLCRFVALATPTH